jgi:ferredoxin-thioredoxin reductase catalytic subunit
MTAEELREMLRKIQEPKGYYFSDDRDHVLGIMNALLRNKERYGYMCCPCRLAAEDPEWDRDIICPCAYREADVAEYGSCYCNLYVSKDWKEGRVPRTYVPERRPADKLSF